MLFCARRPKPNIHHCGPSDNQDCSVTKEKRLRRILGYISGNVYDLGSDTGPDFDLAGQDLSVGLPDLFLPKTRDFALPVVRKNPVVGQQNLHGYMASVPEIDLGENNFGRTIIPTYPRKIIPTRAREADCPGEDLGHFTQYQPSF